MYYTPLEDTVMLGLHAIDVDDGWTALGPAGNGGMKGASQIVVRKDENDEWIAEDRYSMEYTAPSLDEQQDVQLLFAHRDDMTGETAWGVTIPQDSCDQPFDYPIEDHETFMIWAMGSTHDFNFHGANRGQFTANIMGLPPSESDMNEYDYIDLVMPNVSMVREEEGEDPTNAFICSYFDLDALGQNKGFTSDDKIHMVGYEPVKSEGNEKYLHHMTLFSCPGNFDQELDNSHLYHQKVVPGCTNMPPGCEEFIGGWAVGNFNTAYPPNVGVPIGEGNRFLLLQIHYYNPDLTEGVYDSSGIRTYLTKELRPVDAGIMSFAVGVKTGQHPPLPGGQKDTTMETLYVEPDCTMGWSEPLNVFSVQHHSHFLGKHQKITVERDGVNLGSMRTEHVFDYNHQGGVEPNNKVRTLLPGDRLAVNCHFDTTSVPENSTVQIGEESNKEMCFPTLLYYPKQEMSTFAYVPLAYSKLYVNDMEWCSQPSLDEDFESKCAEKLYTDVPGFSQYFDRIGYEGPSFDYPTLCNGGGLSEGIRSKLPDICPDNGCVESQNCSEEELREWAEGVCSFNCGKIGLSLYPDMSRTEPFNTANMGCTNSFFDAPSLAEPAACQAQGNLSQRIELTLPQGIEFANDFRAVDAENSGASIHHSFAIGMLLIFGVSIII